MLAVAAEGGGGQSDLCARGPERQSTAEAHQFTDGRVQTQRHVDSLPACHPHPGELLRLELVVEVQPRLPSAKLGGGGGGVTSTHNQLQHSLYSQPSTP